MVRANINTVLSSSAQQHPTLKPMNDCLDAKQVEQVDQITMPSEAEEQDLQN